LGFKLLGPIIHLQRGNQAADPFRRPAKTVFDAFPYFKRAIVLLAVVVLNKTLADDNIAQQQRIIFHHAWYASAGSGQQRHLQPWVAGPETRRVFSLQCPRVLCSRCVRYYEAEPDLMTPDHWSSRK
jgi:hypothetical protein